MEWLSLFSQMADNYIMYIMTTYTFIFLVLHIYSPSHFLCGKNKSNAYKGSFNVYRCQQCNHHAPWLLLFFRIVIMLLFFIIIIVLLSISLLMFVGGPKAACAGCAGFAAFSVLIEKFLDRHTWLAMNPAPVLKKINFFGRLE